MRKTLSVTVPEDMEGKPVQAVLRRDLQMTTGQVDSAKYREDGICINGVRVRVNMLAHAGDVITVRMDGDEGANLLVPTYEPLQILYEDEDLLAVNKPGNLPSHPSHGHYADTLANRITGYYDKQNIAFRFRAAGRLDMATSGVFITSRNAAACDRLQKQRERKVLRRYYLALCQGDAEEKEKTVDLPIGRVDGVPMKRCVRMDGQRAVSHYRIIRQYEGYFLALFWLDTGRTHQIRVHMASLGHPLLSDHLYDGPMLTGLERAALHACRIECRQPFSGEPIDLFCPLPEDMAAFAGHLDRNDIFKENEG